MNENKSGYMNEEFLNALVKKFSYYSTISRKQLRDFIMNEHKTLNSKSGVSWIISDLIKDNTKNLKM